MERNEKNKIGKKEKKKSVRWRSCSYHHVICNRYLFIPCWSLLAVHDSRRSGASRLPTKYFLKYLYLVVTFHDALTESTGQRTMGQGRMQDNKRRTCRTTQRNNFNEKMETNTNTYTLVPVYRMIKLRKQRTASENAGTWRQGGRDRLWTNSLAAWINTGSRTGSKVQGRVPATTPLQSGSFKAAANRVLSATSYTSYLVYV